MPCYKTLSFATAECPVPEALVYTIDSAFSETYNGSMDIDAMFQQAIIQGTNKVAYPHADFGVAAVQVVDFSAGPAISDTFQVDGETGWKTWGMVYEPVNELIVAYVVKGWVHGVTPGDHKIAFFDPATGYVSSFAIPASTIWTGMGLVMDGQIGKVAFYRSREQSNGEAVITIVNVNTQALEKEIELPVVVAPFYSTRFTYCCPTQEFFIRTASGLSKVSYETDAITASYAFGSTLDAIDYVSSTEEIVCLSNDGIFTVDAATGAVVSSIPSLRDQWDGDGIDPQAYYYLQPEGVSYNHKLDCIILIAIGDQDFDPWGERTLAMFLNPDLTLIKIVEIMGAYTSGIFNNNPCVQSNRADGSMNFITDETGYKFNKLPVTITP